MHFDARSFVIEECDVAPVGHVEVAAEQRVDVAKHIQIERRSHTQRIVVGEIEQALCP